MVAEQGPLSDRNNPFEFLEGRTYVIAETFIIRRTDISSDGSSDEEAKEKVRPLLSSQDMNDSVLVTFCSSEEEQIREIINSPEIQKTLNSGNDQEIIIVGFDADQLQTMFSVFRSMIIKNKEQDEKDPIMEGIEGENITLLLLNAQYPMTPISDRRSVLMTPTIDKRTKVRLIALEKGTREYPARSHPTPAG